MTRARVMKLAEKLDIEIEDDIYCISALAPEGKHFSDEELHILCESYFPGEKASAWRFLWERLQPGLSACDFSDPDSACSQWSLEFGQAWRWVKDKLEEEPEEVMLLIDALEYDGVNVTNHRAVLAQIIEAGK